MSDSDPKLSAAASSVGKQKSFECHVRLRSAPNSPVQSVVIKAANQEEVIPQLLRQGFVVVSIKQVKEAGDYFRETFGAKAKGQGSQGAFSLLNRVSIRELIFFGVQLSTLLKAGIPLLRSLEIVLKGNSNPYFQDTLQKVRKRISEGSSFAGALRECSKVFPWIWVNLVEVGETTGKLPECLEEIAHYQEAASRIQSKIITAFFYPGILLLAVTGAMSFLMLVIVPKFAAIFEAQNMPLPTITKIVVAISDVIRHQALFVLLVAAGVVVVITYVKRSPKYRVSLDFFSLGMPIFGPLSMQVAVVRFSRSLGTLLRSGVQILQALEISGRLVDNAYLEGQIKQVAQAVKGGQGLGIQLEARKIFPVFMTQLLSTGEESGQLEGFLTLIASYYEEAVDTFLARLTVLLEPVMLVFMGGVIGTVVVSMFLPIIQLSTGGGV